jgi:NADH-quinone oxidoreductase subunit C
MRYTQPLTPASSTLEEHRHLIETTLGPLATGVVVHSAAVIAYAEPVNLRPVLFALRDTPGVELDVLSHMTAVDRHPREPRFDVVYELYSLKHRHRCRVKFPLADTGSEETLPEIDSASDIYLASIWHERETYDLFGIRFVNHPDLRRIMLPDRWDGHPLRQDYPFDGKRVWKVGTTVVDGLEGDHNLGL